MLVLSEPESGAAGDWFQSGSRKGKTKIRRASDSNWEILRKDSIIPTPVHLRLSSVRLWNQCPAVIKWKTNLVFPKVNSALPCKMKETEKTLQNIQERAGIR